MKSPGAGWKERGISRKTPPSFLRQTRSRFEDCLHKVVKAQKYLVIDLEDSSSSGSNLSQGLETGKDAGLCFLWRQVSKHPAGNRKHSL